MTTNLRYLIFLIVGVISALVGAAENLHQFVPYFWIPFLIFVYLNSLVDRYQYVALQVAKVCVIEKSPHPSGTDIQILHENLIPNWTARVYFLSCVVECISFFLLLFTQGWIAVIISYILLFIFGFLSDFIPFLKRDFYLKQILGIQNYVELNTMRFQQQIDQCSVSVNEVKETLGEASMTGNPNQWFFERSQNV